MKKLVFLIVIPTIAILIFFLLQNQVQMRLLLWGVGISLPGFKMTNFTGSTLEAEKDGLVAKITKSKVENNSKLVEDRVYLLNSLFEPTTSPYPEVLTNIISCPPEFKPREVPVGTSSRVYALFAGERFGFGVCSQDLVKYRAVYGIFDCRKKGVFEIKLFSSAQAGENKLEKIIQSFNCQNG